MKEVKLNRPAKDEVKYQERMTELGIKFMELKNGQPDQDTINMLVDNEFLSKVAGLETVKMENEGIVYFRVDFPYENTRKHYCISPIVENGRLDNVFLAVIQILTSNGLGVNDAWVLARKDTGTFARTHFHLLIY